MPSSLSSASTTTQLPSPNTDMPDMPDVEKRYYRRDNHDDGKDDVMMKDTRASLSDALPRRKPVPLPKDGREHEHDIAVFAGATPVEKIKVKLGLLDGSSEDQKKRKKRLLVIAVVVGVVGVVALIIGLSVGLTVGKENTANLPLPTGNGGPYTGDLTYYDPALGSCGVSSSASEPICAVSKDLYDAVSTGSDPNQNPLCGLKIRLRRDGKSVDVTVVDRCVGCKPTDIDVSMSVFEKLALVDQGRVLVDWAWIDNAPISPP